MNVYEKLLKVQTELKAPKNQYNKSGNYKYRSCEDIQEGIKPLLAEVKATLVVGDELVLIGERYYIKATARFTDVESTESVENIAYAREEFTKKGMDSSQVTGATSSYARKYALNGLFCIDDVKDTDTESPKEDKKQESKPDLITQKESEALKNLCKNKGLDIKTIFKVPVEKLTKQQYVDAVKQLNKIGAK